MNNIRILPEDVASQIAAGEVIERPASVVKELLDNSIDAGSDRITINIDEGGKKLIRVSDNGEGMNRDDLLLCIERHATSKIKSLSDLFSVSTLGFRGEAIPSIASVSRMKITSRTPDQLGGYCLDIQGGKMKSINEVGVPVGTTVEIRDLFFNTPARRKFLRADQTELGHITDVLSRIVLAFDAIDFNLKSARKPILNLPASGNIINRLSALMGRDVADSIKESKRETGFIKLRAYLAPPEMNRNRGDRLFIYVNNRGIRDRLITRAIMEGYGQRLMKGRYPQAVIFIEIDPDMVDVNVHPSKQEVRFHQGRLIFRELVSFTEASLKEQFYAESGYHFMRPPEISEGDVSRVLSEEPSWRYSGPMKEAFKETIEKDKTGYAIEESPRLIGQLKGTYILFEANDGLLVVDQHAAHERILYEQLKRGYRSSGIERQSFLIPKRFELSLHEADIVREKIDQLADLGFEVEHFGGCTFILRSLPSILVNIQWDQFILDLIPILDEEGELTSDRAMERILTSMACHNVIRAGHSLSNQEMTRLLEDLEELELPTNCPHGRPVFKKMTYYELEKMFKRVP
ncbi:MAG: DNA mismatch repair endonuclease MutL [Deltaproteobacteria bacterium]|nr:DNA mismatch repair endonuclease MutL [Deltaproteobacteria bacterium]